MTGNSNPLNFVDFEAKNLLKSGKMSSKRQKLDKSEILSKAQKLGCSEGLGVDKTGPTWSLVRFVAILCLGDVESFIYENISKYSIKIVQNCHLGVSSALDSKFQTVGSKTTEKPR